MTTPKGTSVTKPLDPPSKPVARLEPYEVPLARLVMERAALIRAKRAAKAQAKPESP